MKTKALLIIPVSYQTKPSLILNVYACMAFGKRCFECCDEIGLCNCNCPVGYSGSSCASVDSSKNYHIDAQPPVCESVDLIEDNSALKATSGDGDDARGHITFVSNQRWRPSSSDPRPYLEIKFGSVMKTLSMIQVAGSDDGFVSEYNLWFRVPNNEKTLWYPVLESQENSESAIKMIPGARDKNPENFVSYQLCPNIRTKRVRIVPKTVVDESDMRIKIFGCTANAPCSTCCTYEEGCTCKCPVGYSSNYQSSSAVNPWEHCGKSIFHFSFFGKLDSCSFSFF